MKNVLSIIFGLLIGISYGQTPFASSFDVGEGTKKGMTQLKPEIIGAANGKIYGLSTKGSKQLIYIYDQTSLDLLETNDFKIKYKSFKLKKEDAFIYNDKVIFITSYINKSEMKKYYFFHEYVGGKEFKAPKVIGGIDWKDAPGALSLSFSKKITSNSSLKISFSADRKKIGVVYPLRYGDYTGENKWVAKVYDENLSEINSNEFNSPKEFNVNAADLAENGNFYLVCAVNEKVLGTDVRNLYQYDVRNTNFINQISGDSIQLGILNLDNNSLKLVPLDIKGASFKGLSFGVTKNRVVFYGIKGVDGEAESLLFEIFDLEGNQLNSREAEIELDAEILEERKSIFNKNASRRYHLNELHETESGDFIFLAEEFRFYVTHYTGTNGQSQDQYNYDYRDLLIVSFSSTGEFNWLKNYDKRQVTTNDFGYYSSYFSVTSNNNLFVILNTSEYQVNQELEGKDKRKAKRNAVVSYIKVSQDGQLEDDVLYNEDQVDDYTLGIRYGFIQNSKYYVAVREKVNMFKYEYFLMAIPVNL